ncbi:rhomboid family intramembrane serine protease [Psychrobacter sp. PP-21]|uniref:rhomboid family intramembrane serine protease n=1 Tax=Psychrobacter sp. PP-21 TaxID=2957503 RepID=UPI0029B8E80E|nr:rhomboid family intramembrane serine protease [Psychrobacter sp. PP-21]MDX2373925.1 rhomboid family intramembrane serine protease [Psychrobacter sp. PP-21]
MTILQLLKTAPITTLLLASFIGLFVLQIVTGVDANNPSTEALLTWGANALPFTMSDEPWRLVSSAFLHIGLMHLLFNSFAMYFFGQIAEPMFGSAKFLALFLLAAIGGNLLNNYVTWQGIIDGTGQPGISAGASGGIMGIGAALLIAALFKISVNGMVLNLKSLVFIMGINLVYGFAVPGIDNAGHIGGAITGLVIALAFAIGYRQRLTVTMQNVAIQQQRNANPYQTTYHYGKQGSGQYNRKYSSQYNSQNSAQLDNQDSYDSSDDAHLPSLDTDFNNQNAGLDSRHSKPDRYDTEIDSDDSSTRDVHSNDMNHSIAMHTASHDPDHNNTIQPTAPPKEPIKPAIIWQLLPWLMMLLISIGFVWWWQDIHEQLLQVLKAIE